MKKILLFLLHWALISSTQAQSTKSIINPDIWLRADMLNGSTVNWPDISGNMRHAISDTGKTLSGSEFMNFNKAITCIGTSNRFKIDYNMGSSTQLTVIAVYDAKGLDEQGIWNTKINSAQEITLTTQRATAPQSITRYTDKNINFPVMNTSIQFWGKSQANAGSSSIILGDGGSGTIPFTGAIAEYLVFNRILSSLELQMIHSYLAIKYGTSLLYTDYITSVGRITWNYQFNQAFSQSIAGIGRDDGFLLNQKQSSYTGEPGLLVIGAGSIASSNEKNTYVLKDGDFLVWGDNGELLEPDTTTIDNNPDNYIVPLRKWLMNVNSRTASDIPSQVCFDVKTITDNPKKCWLAIDRTATGDFSASGIIYLAADSISADGKAWFSNIKWDIDKSGTDLFTFTCGKSLSAFRKYGSQSDDSEAPVNPSQGIYNYKLFPNPSHGAYTLTIQLESASDIIVRIFNSQGTTVKEEKGTGASEYLFKGELSALGIYFVEINTSKGRETFKLIVN